MPSEIILLKSEESHHCYTTRINKKTRATKGKGNEKFEIMKFDPVLKKHVKYKEKKLPKSS